MGPVSRAPATAGKTFDLANFLLITLSVIAVVLESVAAIEARFGPYLRAAEWGFTLFSRGQIP